VQSRRRGANLTRRAASRLFGCLRHQFLARSSRIRTISVAKTLVLRQWSTPSSIFRVVYPSVYLIRYSSLLSFGYQYCVHLLLENSVIHNCQYSVLCIELTCSRCARLSRVSGAGLRVILEAQLFLPLFGLAQPPHAGRRSISSLTSSEPHRHCAARTHFLVAVFSYIFKLSARSISSLDRRLEPVRPSLPWPALSQWMRTATENALDQWFTLSQAFFSCWAPICMRTNPLSSCRHNRCYPGTLGRGKIGASPRRRSGRLFLPR